MNKEDIVYVQLDNWNDMGDATQYLEELENGKYDNEINYNDIWYDMAIVHCITTTQNYVDAHPELEEHIKSKTYIEKDMFGQYFPEYDPNNFGCNWYGEYEGWAPYKEFNKQLWDHLKVTGQVDENGNIKTKEEPTKK